MWRVRAEGFIHSGETNGTAMKQGWEPRLHIGLQGLIRVWGFTGCAGCKIRGMIKASGDFILALCNMQELRRHVESEIPRGTWSGLLFETILFSDFLRGAACRKEKK